mmetsp:Transcript_19420/g.30402  ORF Transcript_19420/g.30402 Transcript_19420/m.30402 type:complete len:85 (-) Transcript_19420:371-625(-)
MSDQNEATQVELPAGMRNMTPDERLNHVTNLYEALQKQGMAIADIDEEARNQIDGFVSTGASMELNIKTPKGHIYCKLQNMVAA